MIWYILKYLFVFILIKKRCFVCFSHEGFPAYAEITDLMLNKKSLI